MALYDAAAIRALIEPDRVHRDIYIDPALFERELERIFGRAWIWVGHESQVKNPGDYVTTTIGRQPVVMSRHSDGKVHVLHNRCGHRDAKVVGDRDGNARFFRCCYHGWTYRTDGTLRGVPMQRGYDATGFDMADPRYGMMKLPRVDLLRMCIRRLLLRGQDFASSVASKAGALRRVVA